MPQEEETEVVYRGEDHPWIEMPDVSQDEVVRYSLDEIRIG